MDNLRIESTDVRECSAASWLCQSSPIDFANVEWLYAKEQVSQSVSGLSNLTLIDTPVEPTTVDETTLQASDPLRDAEKYESEEHNWSGNDPLTRSHRLFRVLSHSLAEVLITDSNGKNWSLRVQPSAQGEVFRKTTPLIDGAVQLDKNGNPTGWAIEKRGDKLGVVAPHNPQFRPLKMAEYNDVDKEIRLQLEVGEEIRLRNDGSITRYLAGLPHELVDANGNSFKYEWSKGILNRPTTVFLKPAESNSLYEYRLNSGILGRGYSWKNWSTDNYTLYTNHAAQRTASSGNPGERFGSTDLSGEVRLHVFANDGKQDGALKVTTGSTGVLQYGLKEISTTWHSDGTKTLEETDYNRIWFDKSYPQRRFNRQNEIILK
jgi:hypothetical protein